MKLFSITLQRWMALIALACIGMLAFGLYLQHVVGLNP
jgi:disulfide bond formation protein DsbB